MRESHRSRRAATALVALVGLAVGCTPDDGDEVVDESESAQLPVASVTVPEERLTPFCQAMIELSDTLVSDPPDDVEALIVETYEAIESDVPDVIAADFGVVLSGLRGEPVATVAADTVATTDDAPTGPDDSVATTEATVDEFLLPPDTPAERVNDYVEFTCRDSVNNPGPPPTAPGVELPPDEDEDG